MVTKGWFPVSRNLCVRMRVNSTRVNKIEAMNERSLVSVKVGPRSTSRRSSALFILHLFYLRDWNLRALTCVAKNASMQINLNARSHCVQCWPSHTLGARDFSSAVSGFCQVFIVTRATKTSPHARKTSGTQGSRAMVGNVTLKDAYKMIVKTFSIFVSQMSLPETVFIGKSILTSWQEKNP